MTGLAMVLLVLLVVLLVVTVAVLGWAVSALREALRMHWRAWMVVSDDMDQRG